MEFLELGIHAEILKGKLSYFFSFRYSAWYMYMYVAYN